MSEDGLREFQLQGKELVFLFMAATVVAVVIFLSGVMVGRGVRVRSTAASADAAIDPTAAPGQGEIAAADRPAVGAKEELTYPKYLEGQAPPPEVIGEPVSAAPAPRERPEDEPVRDAQPGAASRAVLPAANAGAAGAGGTASIDEPPGRGFVVQVAASRDRGDAERMARRLAAKGYPTFVTTSGTGSARMFRVRVGKYRERAEAEAVSRRLETEEQFNPWITR
jgi:cell division septation protein DedD